MENGNIEEEFFLKSINVEHVFKVIERTDYFYLYNIKVCLTKSTLKNGVYLSDLAKEMEASIADTSRAVKHLEEKGYVMWKFEEDKEKTYIVLTNKAIELGQVQKCEMIKAYEKIIAQVSKDDLETTLLTLSKIRKILADNEDTNIQDRKVGGFNMVESYVNLIRKGQKQIDEVPENIRGDVIGVLIESGFPELSEAEIVVI